jgi:hypothetical protein
MEKGAEDIEVSRMKFQKVYWTYKKATGGLKNLHDEDHNLYVPPNIIMVISSRMISRTEYPVLERW